MLVQRPGLSPRAPKFYVVNAFTKQNTLLFSRKNPTESQILLLGNEKLLEASNFNPNRRTAVLLHGWIDHPDGRFSRIVRSAFLEADDMNVIVVDWKDGADIANYFTGIKNTVKSGMYTFKVCQVLVVDLRLPSLEIGPSIFGRYAQAKFGESSLVYTHKYQ
ncbi:hypothetical protein HF086_009803 [Spodoptera exigua]|uniref:Lipase domain-containing protein n=1 Tax=Spodoptera exigua TaxID=7107 RepID=A0A922M0D7_SPOEX|nr:hypothetical protein HF086_009803 [Spodoptera exigua]